MVEILNDLPDFCENCPYIELTHYETLGRGKVAYTCKRIHKCRRVYDFAYKKLKKENINVRRDKNI